MLREDYAYLLDDARPRVMDALGRVLWRSLDHAMTYANVLAIVHKARQEVVPVKHPAGPMMWHVRKARPKVAEPCS
jgi:hypothetical protein